MNGTIAKMRTEGRRVGIFCSAYLVRPGTCSLLPVLLVAVGRRMGYPLSLVHSPGHVFCRWDGLNHHLPVWREKRNIEFTSDFDCLPDQRYYYRPINWPPRLHTEEKQRRPLQLYLRSLAPAEELASFLTQRAHALEAYKRFEEAWAMYATAFRLAPHNDTYAHFAKECQRMHLDHALKPWKLSGQQFCRITERRMQGGFAKYPWEDPQDAAMPKHNPFMNPKLAPLLKITQRAIQMRLQNNHR